MVKNPIILNDDILLSDDDVLRCIREKLGKEIYEIVYEWKDQSEITLEEYQKQTDSDLTNYEEQLNQYETSAKEINEKISDLMVYLENEKRISRDQILAQLESVQGQLIRDLNV